MHTINVPERVIDFARGGEEWAAWCRFHDTADPAAHSRELDAPSVEFWRAVDTSRKRRVGKGYTRKLTLSPEGVEHLRYWADTMAPGAEDNAPHDDDAKADLAALRRLYDRLP